jgi:hypothetical protein
MMIGFVNDDEHRHDSDKNQDSSARSFTAVSARATC